MYGFARNKSWRLGAGEGSKREERTILLDRSPQEEDGTNSFLFFLGTTNKENAR